MDGDCWGQMGMNGADTVRYRSSAIELWRELAVELITTLQCIF